MGSGRTIRNWLGTTFAAIALATFGSSAARAGFTSVQICQANEIALDRMVQSTGESQDTLSAIESTDNQDQPQPAAALADASMKPAWLMTFQDADSADQSPVHRAGNIADQDNQGAAIVVPLPPAVFTGSLVLAGGFAVSLMWKKRLLRL